MLALCWLLLMPPGSGPDEAGHLVRAGAVVRGDLGDENFYTLPDRYRVAEPGCYAFQPTVSAECSAVPVHTGATLDLATNAGPYPVWGHALFGAPTLLPGLDPIWWARLVGAAAAVALVGLSFVRATGVAPAAAVGLLMGITPMAWSTFGTVNPSSIVIAGAIALWTGLLLPDRPDRAIGVTATFPSAGWLTAVGWAALVLPRRDGLVWASITLVIALVATRRTFVEWWRPLTRVQQVLIVAPTVVTMLWGALSDSRSTQFVVIAPVFVLVAEGWRWWWRRPAQTPATRFGASVALGALGVLAAFGLIATRPGGWNTTLAIDIVMQTDDNLVEAIGVLGWLDTVVPAVVVDLWLVAFGMLLAAALARRRYSAVTWAVTLAATIVVTSWVLELVQGNPSGLYWQGRYSIPLLVGVPVLLTSGMRRAREYPDLTLGVVGLLALVLLNVAAWAAARRFGVGTSGSYLPTRWDTTIQPVAPVFLLTAHAAATAWLAHLLMGVPRSPRTVER